MKRPCRYHPTPEQLARLAAAGTAYARDPANRARVSAAKKLVPRRKDGRFAPGTSTILKPWPKGRT
jgi:hypothetical protein